MSSYIQTASNNLSPAIITQTIFPQRPSRAILFTSVVALGLSIPWLINNYRRFIELGNYSITKKPVGYLVAMALKPFGRETQSTAMYDKNPDKEHWLRDPDTIPERRGDRPQIGWHFAPHRQINKFSSPEIQQRLAAFFNARVDANPTLVEMAASPHEKVHPGIIIHPSIPSPHKVAEKSLREIAHLHPVKDYSIHATLAPQDCKVVIERGWGERHPLSSIILPKEYVLIYTPRDEEELEVVERIIIAAIGYNTNTRDVK